MTDTHGIAILVMSNNAQQSELRRRILEKLGHPVLSIMDYESMQRSLNETHCTVAVVGFSVAPMEKRRIARAIRDVQPHCSIIELYEASPDIPDANAHVRNLDGPEALLAAVKSQLPN